NTRLACDDLLANGSRTAHASWRSSQASSGRGEGGPPNERAMPEAMLKTLDSQPVEPAPVATMMPLDDCDSCCFAARSVYRAEMCDEQPMKRSLKASSFCPSCRLASASVTLLVRAR